MGQHLVDGTSSGYSLLAAIAILMGGWMMLAKVGTSALDEPEPSA